MMDRIDEMLTSYFDAAGAPADVVTHATRRAPSPLNVRPPLNIDKVVARVHIEATARGITRISLGRGREPAPAEDRRHAERAREELSEYLAGRRVFFSVPVDLSTVPAFQMKVLSEAARVPFGEVISYATLARRIGHPRAARAVGNALGANPVPILVPCHRIIRGDGTWGHYAFGARLKTALLTLERTTPALVGCTTTRIVCRRGCAHEQRVREDRRIVFASVEDAQGVGYRLCRVCRPPRRGSIP